MRSQARSWWRTRTACRAPCCRSAAPAQTRCHRRTKGSSTPKCCRPHQAARAQSARACRLRRRRFQCPSSGPPQRGRNQCGQAGRSAHCVPDELACQCRASTCVPAIQDRAPPARGSARCRLCARQAGRVASVVAPPVPGPLSTRRLPRRPPVLRRFVRRWPG